MDKGTKRGNSHIEAKSRVLAEGVRIIEELDAVEVQCREFGSLDPSSPAVREDTFVNREGGDPATDFISIRGVHLHLHLKLHAAREHLMGCLTLIGSKGEETLMNPIRSLARSAFESSVTCFWLCNNQITTEERLRRFSQLHLRSTYNALRDMGIDMNNPPDPISMFGRLGRSRCTDGPHPPALRPDHSIDGSPFALLQPFRRGEPAP